jgi:phage-related protein
MAIHYFLWNGVDSRNKHIRVPNRIPVIRPEERVKRITIPGRSGELTETEGTDIYESYIQTIPITIEGAANIQAAEAWLRGAGKVTFDSQSGLEQDARVYGSFELSKHSRNRDKWHGNIQFYCNPIKRDRTESVVTVTTSGTGLNNPGDMVAYPLIKITGSGLVTVGAGGNILTIPECQSGWIIDSENEWILSGTTPQEKACTGAFPILKTGANTVTFTGSVTKLEITPRFRYL